MTARRRWVLIVLFVIAIAAAGAAIVVNVYRDSVALNVANRFLADSDAVVTDVSVDTIGTDVVQFSEIRIGLAGGSTLEVRGVTLPVRFRGFRGLHLHAESLELLPSPGASESPPELAAGLRAFLEAGPAMHGASVEIDSVTLPSAPALVSVAWYGDERNPTVRATVGELDIFFTSTPSATPAHRATLRALTGDDDDALLAAFDILPDGDGISITGQARATLAPLVPLLRFYNALPADVTALDGSLDGPIEVRIESDAATPVPIRFKPTLNGALQLEMQPADAELYSIVVTSDRALRTTFEYPSLSWRAEVDSLALEISGGGFEQQMVDLDSVECASGIRCATNLRTALESIELGGLSVAEATLEADDVEIESTAGQWTAESARARLLLDTPAYAGRQLVTPSIEGDFRATNEQLTTRLRIATPEGGVSGSAEIRHELADGRGRLQFEDLLLDIDILHFSEAFETWPYEWDVTSGTWQIEGDVTWHQTPSGFAYQGRSLHTVESLAGSYGDVGFLGFNTRAELSLENGRTPVVAPGVFELGLVDIGFPIEDIGGRYALDLDEFAVELEDVEMSALGGKVRTAPFRFDFDADSNNIVLDIESVQLPLMVGLADLDSVNISGSVSGGVPISVRNGRIVVEGGFLEADTPGGAIHYRGGAAVADEQTQVGIVARTLENFQFEELTSEVHYSEQGDLKLQMRLTGTNPDVDPDQPVILNLGIENNIPQMLRSLQATRSIEELLEEKLSK